MGEKQHVSASEGLTDTSHPIIVFDGVCVLCTANARFVLKYDRCGHFKLAAMQGTVGSSLVRAAGADPANPETLIIVDGDQVLRNSDAVIAIWRELGWPWKMAGAAKLVPRPIRDTLYGFIARNRYRIFGKLDECWVPTAEQAQRIV